MRVAHVGNYHPGTANGVNETIAGLAEHLPRRGIDVEVWHFTRNVSRVVERMSGAVRIFDVPCFATRATNAVLLPGAAMQFMKERAREIDLLHLHSVFTPVNAWAARLGVPCLLTPNGGYSAPVLAGRHRHLKQVWLRGWERRVWSRCAAIHAVSPPEAAELRELVKGVPIVFIPNGVDETLTRRTVQPPEDGDFLLFLGRLAIDHKGLDLLLHGYHRAHRAAGARLPKLVIAGPDFREGRRRLLELISSLELSDAVAVPGPVYGEEKWDLLGAARCFVHTSRWEGLPFAVLEAMALGRPVLVTSRTNLQEFVEDHCAGWITEPGVEGIAGALLRIADAPPGEVRARGDAARRLVGGSFTWHAVAGQIVDLYGDVQARQERACHV